MDRHGRLFVACLCWVAVVGVAWTDGWSSLLVTVPMSVLIVLTAGRST